MQYEEFVGKVNERAGTAAPGDAEYAIQATLATLGEHLTGSEARDLAAKLPPELEAQLASGDYAETAEGFSSAKFYRRLAEREDASGTGSEHARATVQAVLAVLSEAAGGADLGEAPRKPPRETAPLPNA